MSLPQDAAPGEADARTRRALLHMLEDLQREREVIRQARREWVDTVDSITDPLFVTDREQRVVRCNRAYAARAGLQISALLGRRYWECFPKMTGPIAIFDAPFGEYATDEGEVFVSRAYRIGAVGNPQGHVLHVLADITQQRHAEDRFRGLVESSADIIWEMDENCVYTYVSPQVLRITGHASGDLVGRSVFDIMPAEEAARVRAWFEPIHQRAAPFAGFENTVRRADGALVVLESSGTPIIDAQGRLRGYRCIDRDVTERKAADAKIRALARFPHENPHAVIRVAADGTVLFANPASADVLANAGAAAGGRVNDGCLGQVRRCLHEGRVVTGEMSHAGRAYALTFAPIAAEGYVNVYGVEITDRKRYEHELEFANAVLSTQQETSLDGILVVDREQKIVSYNRRFVDMWGILDEVAQSRSDEKAIQSVLGMLEAPEEFIAQVKYLYEHPDDRIRDELRLKDGRVFDRFSAPMRAADDTYYGRVWYFRDVTEARRAELELKRSNRALRTLSAGNEALVRARDEPALLAEMCRIIVDVGGYRDAWVGYRGTDPKHRVLPMASAGIDLALLHAAAFSWDGANAGLGPVGAAIGTGTPQVVMDIDIDPRLAPWRRAMLAHGLRSLAAYPLATDAQSPPFGAIGIGSADPFAQDELKLLQELAGDLAYGIVSLRSDAERRAGAEKLRRGLESTIDAIAATVETRDPYTAGHQRRVAGLAAAIAREMGLPAHTVEGIHFGALIHDLGKIQVPAEILAKPSRLSPLEYELIKAHAQAGYDIVKGIEFPWPVAKMVLQHHERLDGSGYPQGAKGEEIALEARILAVADVVEAMASHRPYRPGRGIDAALDEIEAKRGTWFEPTAVDACLRLFRAKGYALDST